MTAARAVPQRAASEETRRQILDTALAAVPRAGLRGDHHPRHRRRAGLSLGAAYYYFKSKEAIVGAYYDYVQQEHRDAGTRGVSARARPA